jgi:hypothetical protein
VLWDAGFSGRVEKRFVVDVLDVGGECACHGENIVGTQPVSFTGLRQPIQGVMFRLDDGLLSPSAPGLLLINGRSSQPFPDTAITRADGCHPLSPAEQALFDKRPNSPPPEAVDQSKTPGPLAGWRCRTTTGQPSAT